MQTSFPAHRDSRPDVDVVVAGAGLVGLALAIAVAQEGLSVAAVGPEPPAQAGRTVALLDGSVRLLSAIGVWPRVAQAAAPLRTMRLVDDTPSLFRGPPVSFEAAAVGLPAFGYNLSNDALVAALGEVAEATPGLSRVHTTVTGHLADDAGVSVFLDGHAPLRGRVLIAADGAGSVLRSGAGIEARVHHYPQVALTTVLTHTRPHADISTEFHTRQGPFTLVPMSDEAGQHRSSLVWVMAPAEADRRGALPAEALVGEINRQSRGLLGRVTAIGRVGRFPIRRVLAERLVAPRFALAGEAAHALPPIGAQGLNLSLRDAATLVDLLAEAKANGDDPGAPGLLARYERSRAGDIALRGAGVHVLNLSLLSGALPVDLLRSLGLRALGAVPALRDAVMRQGLRPSTDIPRLMRTALLEA